MTGESTAGEFGGHSSRIVHQAERLSQLKAQLLLTERLEIKLKWITDEVVSIFGADFARIWVVMAGDLCDRGCIHTSVTEGPHACRNRSSCLHLLASSGRYTHTDGDHRRVPLGAYKIGRVASGAEPKFITNDVTHDPRVHGHEWARELGLVSFAGFRLLSPKGLPVGVLALFSKQVITPDQELLLEDLANTTSHVITAGIAEEDLREERNRAKKYFDMARVMMLVLDPARKVLQVNQKGCEVLGRPKDEVIGRDWFENFVPESLRREAAAVFQDIVGGRARPFERNQGSVLTRDGEERLIEWRHAVLYDKGKISSVLSSGEDITERRRAEDERRRFYRETILNATDGKLDICEREDVQPYIANADTSMEVWAASDFSDVLSEVQRLCMAFGLDEESMWSFAVGVGEAITNAIKHASGGCIYIGRRNQGVWVAVADNGPGIDSLVLPASVLRRGFSTKPSMGLGYAIMLDVSDRMLLNTGKTGTTIVLVRSLAKKVPDVHSLPDTWGAIP